MHETERVCGEMHSKAHWCVDRTAEMCGGGEYEGPLVPHPLCEVELIPGEHSNVRRRLRGG
jgi:hypothetical protein